MKTLRCSIHVALEPCPLCASHPKLECFTPAQILEFVEELPEDVQAILPDWPFEPPVPKEESDRRFGQPHYGHEKEKPVDGPPS